MRYVLAPIKFVLFVIGTCGLYLVWFVFSFVIPNGTYWRQLIFTAWTRFFASLAGMKIEVIGEPPHPPFFLVANHLSYVDIAALRAVVTGIFVAKKEIDSWLLAGRMVRGMGNIYIDRGNRRDIPRAGDEIIAKLNEGEGVIVFPEGTSTKGENVLPFNSSFFEFAARTDLPVSYVSISYRTPEGQPPASQMICWWDDISFIEHMLRLFTLQGFTAVLSFGESEIVNTDRKQLASELRRKVKEKFIPVI